MIRLYHAKKEVSIKVSLSLATEGFLCCAFLSWVIKCVRNSIGRNMYSQTVFEVTYDEDTRLLRGKDDEKSFHVDFGTGRIGNN